MRSKITPLFALAWLLILAAFAQAQQQIPVMPPNSFFGRLGGGGVVGPGAAIPFGSAAFNSTVAGTVPPSGGGTTNFLRADGTWSVPGGLGGASASGTYTLSHATGAWVCSDPTGATVSTSGTTTSGLQECVNAMQTNKTGNFRAVCPPFSDSVPISATTTVTFGPAIGYNYDLRGCYFATTAAPGIIFDTFAQGTNFDWSGGYITCTNETSDCVLIRPTSGDPVFGGHTFGGGFLRLPYIQTPSCTGGAGSTPSLVHINTNNNLSFVTAFYAEFFSIDFLDGGPSFCPTYGLLIDNPTNVNSAVGQNFIWIGYITSYSAVGISEGISNLNPATQALATNTWFINTIGNTHTGASAAFITFGFQDEIHVNVSVNSGTLANCLDFGGAASTKNFFIAPQLSGCTTAVADSGSSNLGFFNGTAHGITIP